MNTIITVSALKDWPLRLPGVEIVEARDYLTDPGWQTRRGVRVYNLCRSYRYQSTGYYVSLLATARQHRPFPDLITLLDMRSRTLVRAADDELDELVQRSLAPIKGKTFTLSVYFGQNLARQHGRLARAIFGLFRAPLVRAQFVKGDRWRLTSVGPIPAREIPKSHYAFVAQAAEKFLVHPGRNGRKSTTRFDLAMLLDPEEALPPSNERALRRFERAGQKVGFSVERIGLEDYSRLSEFDALFIRETTRVNHHTFRFAQRAQSEGLAVIDDPQSILRCSNKVYLAEQLSAKRIAIPKTVICNKESAERVLRELGIPCVLKTPDGAFSQGVVKVNNVDELESGMERIFDESDLLVAQEFLPTAYDWRVGVFDGELLYACRYHMVSGHWQIVQDKGAARRKSDRYRYGRVEHVSMDLVPSPVLKTAKRAAAAIGKGLYGVDLKVVGRRCLVMEVNDNPNIDAGFEDLQLGDELYERIMTGLLRRVETLKGNAL